MDNKVSAFWTNWIIFIGIMVAFLGLLLSYTPFAHHTLGPMYYDHYVKIDAYQDLAIGELMFQKFLYGISGALLTSWGIAIAWIAHRPFRAGQKWAWNVITLTLLTWFIGDGFVSIITGFEIHAFMNAGLLTGLGLPLIMTRKQFKA